MLLVVLILEILFILFILILIKNSTKIVNRLPKIRQILLHWGYELTEKGFFNELSN